MRIGDFSMRSLQESDLRQVLAWRNSDHVHSVMMTAHKITWEEHYAWFKRHEHDEPHLHFILQYKNKPIGYISYNDCDFKQSIIKDCGVYLGEREEIPLVCRLALFFFVYSYAFETLDVEEIHGQVLDINKPAQYLHRQLGYEVLPEQLLCEKGGKLEPYHDIRMQREYYEQHKRKFIDIFLKNSSDKTVSFSSLLK